MRVAWRLGAVRHNLRMPKTRTQAAPALSSALAQPLADKRIEILRRIVASGSISQAAREAGVSYKAAWQAIDTLTNLAGVALVERAVGGAGGGGAQVTPAGRQLLAAADALDTARREVLARLAGGAAAPALPRLAVRTSMRNQLPCLVADLARSGQIVQVGLVLADGGRLVSRITQESAELLGLAPGLAVLALCKATAVAVQRAGGPAAKAGANVLAARARRVARGDSGDEIAAEIGAGLQVVGFAPAGSGLRSGARVELRFDAAAVVIALAD